MIDDYFSFSMVHSELREGKAGSVRVKWITKDHVGDQHVSEG